LRLYVSVRSYGLNNPARFCVVVPTLRAVLIIKAWFSLATQAQALAQTQAIDNPSENEIRRKHKHKQNHQNLQPLWKTV